jgi:hypothetical protein
MEKRIVGVEHQWVESSDRWIYIERYSDGSLGINFMQSNDHEYFVENATKVDKALSAFYESMVLELRDSSKQVPELAFIDKVIWIWFAACNAMDEYKN